MRPLCLSLWVVSLAACSRVKGPEGTTTEMVESNLEDIWAKIFVRQCAQSSCHSMEGHRSGLVLATDSDTKLSDEEIQAACLSLVHQEVENSNVKGEIRVIPGDAQNSFLVKVLEGTIDKVSECDADEDCNCPMPFKNDCSTTMPADRILAIRQWIDGMPPGGGCIPGADTVDVGPDAPSDASGDGVADGVAD